MGNHTAGRIMGDMAAELMRVRRDWDREGRYPWHGSSCQGKPNQRELALHLLDAVCLPWVGVDAEFESHGESPPCGDLDALARMEWPRAPWQAPYVFYTDPNGPLGILARRAFECPWTVKTPGYVMPRKWDRLRLTDGREGKLWEQWNGVIDLMRLRYRFC